MRAANLPSILAPPGRTALVQRVLHALAGWRSYPRVKRDAAAADRSCLSACLDVNTHTCDSRPRGGGQHVGGTHTMSFLRRWTRSPITGHVWTVWVCFAGPFRPRTVSCGAPVSRVLLLHVLAPVQVGVYGSAGAAHVQFCR